MEREHIAFEWEAPEYIKVHHKADWYWAVGIICVAISVSSFLLHSYLFAGFILAACVLIFYHSTRPGKMLEHKVGDSGIRVGDMYFPYDKMTRFAIDERPGETRLYMQLHEGLLPIRHTIISEDVPIDELADFINDFVPEEPITEPKLMQILERLGF